MEEKQETGQPYPSAGFLKKFEWRATSTISTGIAKRMRKNTEASCLDSNGR